MASSRSGTPGAEPTYKITLIIERTDEPGAAHKAVYEEIPRESAERSDYFVARAVAAFRLLCLGEEI